MNENEYLALPVPQRKNFQKELIAKGLYHGPVDGLSGDGMRTALTAMERERAETAERERKAAAEQEEKSRRLKIEETKTEAEAEERRAAAEKTRQATEEAKAKSARKAKYNEEAGSGLGIGTDIAATIGAPAVTGIAGYKGGQGINWGLDKAQEFRNRKLEGVAADRLSGLTTREGAREGARLSGAMPIANRFGRVGSRMVPHLGLGAFGLGKGAATLADAYANDDDPFYAHEAKKAAGLGYIGAGAGMMKAGAGYASSPGISPDARALAIINSNQLRRAGLAGTPGADTASPVTEADRGSLTPVEDATTVPKALAAPEGEKPVEAAKRGHRERLIAAAKQADATGKLDKQKAAEHLLAGTITPENRAAVARELGVKPGPKFDQRIKAAITNMAKKPGASSILGPALAAGTAYLATPDRAEASTGETRAIDRSEALTNAGLAGGLAYGVGKLIPKGAMPLVGGVMGPVSAMTGPDFTPESEEFGRNNAIRDMPFLRHLPFGGYREAYDKSLVPDRNPLRTTPSPGNQYFPLSSGLMGAPDDDAINGALDVARRARGGRVTGGLHYEGGGRTDNIPLDVPRGTYIIPADIVSALGQGNTLAGIKVLDNMFPPQSDMQPKGERGKQNGHHIPIIAAGGEFQIDPYHVAALGNGDIEHGADILDTWIGDVRGQHIQTLSSLPSPAQ